MEHTRLTQVLLVQLYGSLQPPNWEPFSCEVLASALEKHCDYCQAEIMVVNPLLDSEAELKVIDAISNGQYDLVGLSVPQATRQTALSILSALEERLPPTKRPLIVLGNALPTNLPESFLKLYPWTVVVKGWGEDALVSLVRMLQHKDAMTLANIPSVAYIQDGEMQTTTLSYRIVPEKPKRYHLGQYFPCVETSRGCHYGRCTFCLRPPGRKDYWSRIPLETILASVRELKEAGITYFTFVDEDFIGNDPDGALAIALGLRQIGGMNFSFSVRADNFHSPRAPAVVNAKRLETFKALYDAGLRFVFIGLESLSNSQLKRYGKGNSVEAGLQAVQMVKSLGITVEAGFITFDPFVTLQELHEISSNLRTFGIWENVDHLYQHMRVQKNTPYEKMLANKGMLKEFDLDMLSYEWDYPDPIISAIAKACIGWEDQIIPVYIQARNLYRTKRDFAPAQRFIREIRYLNFKVLEELINRVSRNEVVVGKPVPVHPHLHERGHQLARELQKVINVLPAKEDAENLLLTELENFLSNC